MNKVLLYSLLSITFIGDVKSNEEHLHGSIWEPLHFTEKEYASACFYTEDNFQGESVCLEPPMMIDFYNSKNYHLNDRISSIKIPEDVQVTIYKNDKFNPPYYNLVESIGLNELKKIDIAGQISAISVLKSPGICIQDCVIFNDYRLDLNNIFNEYKSVSEDSNKIILINLEINNESNFLVGFINYIDVLVFGKELFISTKGSAHLINLKLSNNADNLSLLFKLSSSDLQFQYMEAKGTEPLNTPFWVNTEYPSGEFLNFHISNAIPFNDKGNISENITPLILNKTIMALNKHPHRGKRGFLGLAGCLDMPLLAMYNLASRRHCDQLDRLVGMNEFAHDDGEGKTLIVAGQIIPQPAAEPSIGLPLEVPTPSMLLTNLNTHLHNQALTLPAVAKTCKTSVDDILGTRYPRQTGIRCDTRLSRLLADFTLLFGTTVLDWTNEHLTQVIRNIAEHGTTGYAGSDQPTEDQLVRGIQSAISDLGIRSLTTMLQEAFNYAQLSYAHYFMQNEDQATLATPQEAQNLPLGEYTLLLEHYIHPEERPAPLIRDNDQWITPENLYFDVTVISGGNQDISTNLTEEVLEVVDNWCQYYSQFKYRTDNSGNPLTSQDRTIYAALITSHMLADILSANPSDYQFVVVKLKGKIISVLASQNKDNNEDSDLSFSITAPQYVLTPNKNGSVRGAGTAAVRELARYLKEKGRKTLNSEVISQPSARVKTKLGFEHA